MPYLKIRIATALSLEHVPFHVFATNAANLVGTKWAFLAALLVIALWLVSGPYFHYSDTCSSSLI